MAAGGKWIPLFWNRTCRRILGLCMALTAGVVLWRLPLDGLSLDGQKCLALSAAGIILWAFEVFPLGYTSMGILMGYSLAINPLTRGHIRILHQTHGLYDYKRLHHSGRCQGFGTGKEACVVPHKQVHIRLQACNHLLLSVKLYYGGHDSTAICKGVFNIVHHAAAFKGFRSGTKTCSQYWPGCFCGSEWGGHDGPDRGQLP